MTPKRFKLHPESNQWIWDTEAKTKKHKVYSSIDAKELINLLNELHEKNERLRKAVDNCQFRTLHLLDYIKEKDVVTHQEIKDWWNSEVMK